MGIESLDMEKVENALKGRTLRVYWYLLTVNEVVTAREVQRKLKLSSPSLALYHLERLCDLKLVQKNKHGQYLLVAEVKVGVLRFFVRLRWMLVPRQLFSALFFTTLLLSYVFLFPLTYNVHTAYVFLLGSFGIITSWYETLNTWRQKPV